MNNKEYMCIIYKMNFKLLLKWLVNTSFPMTRQAESTKKFRFGQRY